MSRPVGLRHFLGSLLAGSCLLLALQACGGRSDTEEYLFGDGSGAASGSGGAGTGTGSRGPAGVGATGQGANGSGQGGSGTGAATSVGGNDAGAGAPMGEGGFATGGFDTGGTGQGEGGSDPMGTAGEGSSPTIGCGASRCDALSQVCCVGLGATGCIPNDRECSGAALTCTNSAECGDDQVCCLRLLGDVGGSSRCKQRCVTNGMPQNRERQLCSSDRECATNHCRPTVFGVNMCTRR